jgi:hypothetical protein
MTTLEPELTKPVDLCTADGSLNPAARGWSRRPLHRANLDGRFGLNKRWDYWAIAIVVPRSGGIELPELPGAVPLVVDRDGSRSDWTATRSSQVPFISRLHA